MEKCIVKNCFNEVKIKSRGLCNKHYQRFMRYGSPYVTKREYVKGISPYDRIMAKVVVDKKTGCLNFTGGLTSGYGSIEIGGKSIYSHRFMYEHFKGKIPDGKFVCHSCDNPKCCNPEHLWVGTHQDNMRDKHQKGRCPSGEKHSRHKLTSESVRLIRKAYAKYAKGRGCKDNWCTQQFLADKFNISRREISSIITNFCWKNIQVA